MHFLRSEWRKVLATFITALFFFYFWLNGPINPIDPVIQLDEESSIFSKPKLIREKKEEIVGSKEIGDAETHGYGHGILLDRKDSNETSGFISQVKSGEELINESKNRFTEHIERLIPGSNFTLHSDPIVFAEIHTPEKLLYFESRGYTDEVKGYAGPVNTGVLINEKGEIEQVSLMSSRETESYLKKIASSGFYDQFNALPLTDEHKIDAVSGATLTSKALAETSTRLLQLARPEPLITFADIDELKPFNVEARLSLWWVLHISIIALMFLYGFQKKWRKSKKGILILSIASVVYIGFFLNSSFTYITFLHPFLGTSVSSLLGLYALLCLLGSIWGKNTYCKYVCPFGNAQRLMLKITPKTLNTKFPIPNKWIVRIRAAIAIILISGILLGLRSWSNFELFPDLFGWQSLSLWSGLALITVALTIRFPMIWCRLLCPTGALLDGLSNLTERSKNKR